MKDQILKIKENAKNEIQKDSSFIANLFVLFCTGEEYNHQSSYL